MEINKFSPSLKFRWKNFKAFEDTNWIELKPITLFLGCNSTGKSSLIQPFLLLGQSMTDIEKKTLKTKGPYFNGGTYKDLVYKHNVNSKIELALDFNIKGSGKFNEIGDYPPSKIILEFNKDPFEIPELNKYILKDSKDNVLLKRILKENGDYSINFFRKFKQKSELDKKKYSIICKHKPNSFLFREIKIIEKIIEPYKSINKPLSIDLPISSYIQSIGFINHQVSKLIKSIKYVGPIRERPKRYYEITGDISTEVGTSGENTHNIILNIIEKSKLEILNYWLRFFGLAKSIECKRIPKAPDLLQVNVSNIYNSLKINIADACFGLPELLPVLVQSIVSETNDIVLVEQPEVHLNPKLEISLSDFIVDIANKNKVKFIIETHSEHILLRLRTLIKSGKIKNTDVAIYFTEHNNRENIIRKIELDELGLYKNKDWPKGFFEDTLIQSLKYATATKQ